MMEDENREKHVALILAGGHGGRINAETPKQFLCIDGEPVIIHTLKAFEHHPEIDGIAVVCIPGWEEALHDMAGRYGLRKMNHIFTGGASSHDSICNGIKALAEKYAEGDIVLVHEAVRPLVSARIISENIRICREKGNAITAIRDNEAVMYSKDGRLSRQCFPREVMYKAQTPHTFRLKDLSDAYAEAGRKGVRSQSLYTLMADLGRYPLYIAEGERYNIKLTLPEDLFLCRALLEMKRQTCK